MSDSKVIFKYQDWVIGTYINQLPLDWVATDVLDASGSDEVVFSYLIKIICELFSTASDSSLPLNGIKVLIEVLYKLSHCPVLKEDNLAHLELDDMIIVERWIKVGLNK